MFIFFSFEMNSPFCCCIFIAICRYVGYGPSRLEGRAPSEAGCYRAAAAAWDHATAPAEQGGLGLDPADVVRARHVYLNKQAHTKVCDATVLLTACGPIRPRGGGGQVIYGQSIGSGPALELASSPACRGSVAGLVLASPVLSGGAAILGPRVARLLARPVDIFLNYEKVRRV